MEWVALLPNGQGLTAYVGNHTMAMVGQGLTDGSWWWTFDGVSARGFKRRGKAPSKAKAKAAVRRQWVRWWREAGL